LNALPLFAIDLVASIFGPPAQAARSGRSAMANVNLKNFIFSPQNSW